MWYIIAKDIITFILTASGIVVACLGLTTWKKQIKGDKEFQVFYKLNYYLLELRNAIKYVRSPSIFPSETQKAKNYFLSKYSDVDKENFEKNSTAYVYEMRWEKITIAYTKMESYSIAAEVLWGKEILEKVNPLKRKVKELSIMLLQNFIKPDLRAYSQKEIDDIIYDKGSEDMPDKFSLEVNNAIKTVADYIKQKAK